MKKVIALLAVILSIICLGACNSGSEGTADHSEKAIIKMPDGSIETIGIRYTVGHEGYARIDATDGKTYWVSYENCIIIKE